MSTGIFGVDFEARISTSARLRLFSLALVAVAVSAPQTGRAWGVVGHQVVAALVEDELTPKTREDVRRLLALEGASSLVDITVWADRQPRPPGAPRHTVRLPLDASPYDAARVCPRKRCVVGGIETNIAVLRDPAESPETRLVALKYVVHLVADVHQPLHASARNGLDEKIDIGWRASLQKLWDTSILGSMHDDYRGLAERFRTEAEAHPPPTGGTPESWAIESRDIARDVIFPPLQREIDAGAALARPPSFLETYQPIVQQRLTQAALRIADILNSIFDPGSPPAPLRRGTDGR